MSRGPGGGGLCIYSVLLRTSARVHVSSNEWRHLGWHATVTSLNTGSRWSWKLGESPTWSQNHDSVRGKMPPKNNYFQLFNMLCNFRRGDARTGLHSCRTSAELLPVYALNSRDSVQRLYGNHTLTVRAVKPRMDVQFSHNMTSFTGL